MALIFSQNRKAGNPLGVTMQRGGILLPVDGDAARYQSLFRGGRLSIVGSAGMV
jgi:hypothetical protein